VDQPRPSNPQNGPAAEWLAEHAHELFAAVRRVVADALCAYDLGLELSALIGHRWDTFDAQRHLTRMAWALRLAAEIVSEASARGAIPTGERRRGAGARVVTLSAADLQRLSDLARESLSLDDAAGDALAAMQRGAPSPGSLSRLRVSDLVRRSSSDVRQDA
jgi:hypothetical protein